MLKGLRGSIVQGLVLLIAAAISPARGATLEFEDLFGPCGVLELVTGPGNTVIEGVAFNTPDPHTFNFGQGGTDPVFLRTSFLSDWYAIFTFDGGATITFPEPVSSISFDGGNRDTNGFNTYKLRKGTTDLQTFSTFWTSRTHITQTFDTPVTSINFQFVSGPTSLLGIDTLTYTPASIPEPTAGLLVPPLILFFVRFRELGKSA